MGSKTYVRRVAYQKVVEVAFLVDLRKRQYIQFSGIRLNSF